MNESTRAKPHSAPGNCSVSVQTETPNPNPIHKREADPESHDLVPKKSRTESSGVEEARNPEVGLDENGADKACQLGSQASASQNAAKGLAFDIEADAAEDKGTRHTMEDAWVVLLDASLDYPGKLRCAHFAIYDGHGGRLAAEYAQKHLHGNVLSAGLPRELLDVKAAKKAIFDGFRKTDESLLQESAEGGWQDGATAVCVWVLGQKVFVANVGDAKAVLARSTVTDGSQDHSDGVHALKAIVLTREHKAIYPQERARIQKAGGVVSSNGRLQGRLEVSRGFGDRQFKKVGVIAAPDIHSFDLTDREHFIILGCDGLWGVFGPSDAVDFVQKLLNVHVPWFTNLPLLPTESEVGVGGHTFLQLLVMLLPMDFIGDLTAAVPEGLPVTAVSRRLVREAVRERCCKDNCTAIVIVFKRN